MLVRLQRPASNLPETMARYATHSTTWPRFGKAIDLD